MQTAERVSAELESKNVGVIMSGIAPTPMAQVQVASIQTLRSRGAPEEIQLIVLDECHHYPAEKYRELLTLYPNAIVVGLTATPWRDDGIPLGDIHDHMEVAARYSELIDLGHIVEVTVLAPEWCLGSDIAQDPVEAWLEHARALRTLMYFPRVDMAVEAAERLSKLGYSAVAIHGESNHNERVRDVGLFADGKIQVLCACDTLKEGFDVPEVQAIVSSKPLYFRGTMMQVFGRALRPSKGKRKALIIDLTGSTRMHGSPTDDQPYTLKGRDKGSRTAPTPTPPDSSGDRFEQRVIGIELKELRPDGYRVIYESNEAALSAAEANVVRKFGKRFGRAGAAMIEGYARGNDGTTTEQHTGQNL